MWLYNFGLTLYVWLIRLVAPRHPKARLWIDGRKDLYKRMAETIDPTDRIVWVHVASLGEFEQDDRARRRRRAEGRLRPGQLDPAHHPLTGMSTTAETGRAGERAAAEYLRRAGYEICALNWRSGRYELDIVARKAGIVHFVEVKTRRAGSLTPPEAAVTPQKFRALTRAAVRYLAATGGQDEAQFDLAAVDVMPDGHMEVRLVEQAMEYNW